MALLTIQADLKPLVAVLTRIADALDRQWPVKKEFQRGKMLVEEDIQAISDEDLWKREIEDQQKKGLVETADLE